MLNNFYKWIELNFKMKGKGQNGFFCKMDWGIGKQIE